MFDFTSSTFCIAKVKPHGVASQTETGGDNILSCRPLILQEHPCFLIQSLTQEKNKQLKSDYIYVYILLRARGRVRRPLGGGSYLSSHQTPRNCRPSHMDNSMMRWVA